ncbi:MAG TPA: PDZ domain-containing protein [Gammaproteobacteria bacterium]|nr:PDZ domain-containing protein [Gammaproteobacteria bacterium]
MFKLFKFLLLLVSWAVMQSAEATPALPYFQQQDKTFPLSQLPGRLQGAKVILIGEEHTRYGQHLTQLAIIRTLLASGKPLTIAMEYFQQPFQQALDDYIAGNIDEAEMLRSTEYFSRWRYDYRLYRPILRYAKAQKIPLLALNVATELTAAVSIKGFAGLSALQKAQLPDRTTQEDATYIAELRPVYEQHRKQRQGKSPSFEYFLQAQVLWDEGMAQRAAGYLKTHPSRLLVILAGTQHVKKQGIPNRLRRRLAIKIRALQPASAGNEARQLIHYYPLTDTLPRAGLLGVMLKTEKGLEIINFSSTSSAPKAGLKKGDRIVAINDQSVTTYADLKLALLGMKPDQTITVKVLRADKTAIKATFKLH